MARAHALLGTGERWAPANERTTAAPADRGRVLFLNTAIPYRRATLWCASTTDLRPCPSLRRHRGRPPRATKIPSGETCSGPSAAPCRTRHRRQIHPRQGRPRSRSRRKSRGSRAPGACRRSGRGTRERIGFPDLDSLPGFADQGGTPKMDHRGPLGQRQVIRRFPARQRRSQRSCAGADEASPSHRA